MRRRFGLALLALLLLASAFGLSALATEWRQETTDISPLATQVSGLASDVEEIRSLLEATPTPTPLPPTPSPTPEPVVARMANGAVVEWQGMRLRVDGYHLGSGSTVARADFTLENVDAALEATGLFGIVKVVDNDGSVCTSGSMSYIGDFEPLQPGEKLTYTVYWECRDNRITRTMTLGDGVIVFEFPQP